MGQLCASKRTILNYLAARSSTQRPTYGIDAPGLVRGFFLSGAAALIFALGVNLFRFPSRAIAARISMFAQLASIYSFGMGCYMLYGSLFGKVSDRHRLLDLVPWSGNETVLDVGCGRGLLLVAAARRVPLGRVVGIDIWQAADQSGNQPHAALANARVEGVVDKVEVQTADIRQMPFADASFDVVVSHWVVHNLADLADRERALAEIARIFKPGGYSCSPISNTTPNTPRNFGRWGSRKFVTSCHGSGMACGPLFRLAASGLEQCWAISRGRRNHSRNVAWCRSGMRLHIATTTSAARIGGEAAISRGL